MPRRRIRIKPSPTYIRQRLELFRDECIAMEAEGNPGSYGGAPGDDADMRRNICFWGSGRGWQLYKGWRAAWTEKYPDIELPPAPPPKAKPKRVSREQLRALVTEYKQLRPNVGDVVYFADSRKPGWNLETWTITRRRDETTGEEWNDYRDKLIYLGQNGEEAAYWLRQIIEKWKTENNISGQEPRLGTVAAVEEEEEEAEAAAPEDQSGMEPMISRKDQD
jgi:hypothetical protein